MGEFLCRHFNIEDGRNYATLQHIMLYYFKKGKNTTETHKKICAVYGEGAVTDQMCQKWFAKFHAEDYSLFSNTYIIDLLLGWPKSPFSFFCKIKDIFFIFTNNFIDLDILSMSAISRMV